MRSGSTGGEKFLKQKLFIRVGLVLEILFLAQLGLGVTPYPDCWAGEHRCEKFKKTKLFIRAVLVHRKFYFWPSWAWGVTSSPDYLAREDRW